MGEHDEQDPREEQAEERVADLEADGVTDLDDAEGVTEVDEGHVNRAEGPVL